MATIKCRWVWNDIIPQQKLPPAYLYFDVKYKAPLSSDPDREYNQISMVQYNDDLDFIIGYEYKIQKDSGGYSAVHGKIKEYNSNVVEEEYKIIDFGETEQWVSDDFYNWFIQNAKPQHTIGEWIDEIPVTCEGEGTIAHYKCAECGTPIDENKNEIASIVIPPLGHDIVKHAAKAPNCTDMGWNAYETCTRCDHSTFVPIPATGHEWEEATCTEPRMCAVCRLTEGEPLGHDWIDATDTSPKTCARCGATEGDPYGGNVTDTDRRFSIDPKTREITNLTEKNKVIQYDHNSERFTFELPTKYIEGHNVMHCDKIEVHYINISSTKSNVAVKNYAQSQGVYLVNDLRACPEDKNKVMFSWLISANATKYAGTLNFIVRFSCLDGDSVQYAWHTDVFKGITVSDGMNNGEAVVNTYPDVLEAWKNEVHAEYLKKTDAADIYATKEELKEELVSVEGGAAETYATKDELLNMNVKARVLRCDLGDPYTWEEYIVRENYDSSGNEKEITSKYKDGVLTVQNSNAAFGTVVLNWWGDIIGNDTAEISMTFSMKMAGVDSPNAVRGGICFNHKQGELTGTFAHIRGDGEYCIQTYRDGKWLSEYSFDARENKINAEYETGAPYTLKVNFSGNNTFTFSVYDQNGVLVAQKADMPAKSLGAGIGVFCRGATVTVTDFTISDEQIRTPRVEYANTADSADRAEIAGRARCDENYDIIHHTYAKKTEVQKVYEYEREFFYVETTEGLDYSDPGSPQPIRIFNREYDGKTLDFGQVILSGYVNWKGKSCYICHDITRQLQSMEDETKMATRLGGVYCVLGDYNIAFYDFKLDLERNGDQYTAIASNLVIGSGTSASARASKVADMSNLVCRTILYDKVTVI